MKPLIALLLLSVGAACAVESCEPPVYVEAVQEIKVTKPEPACGNVACGVANCDCVDCRCELLGACLPAPVVQVQRVSETKPVAIAMASGSAAASACRRNADGSWSCGPRDSGSRSAGSGQRICSPQRTGPVRSIVRRLFGG